MKPKKIILILSAVIALTKISFSQTLTPTVVSCYGKFSGAGGYSLSATGGEPMTETFSAGNNILTQGFQQPDFISTGITVLNEAGFLVKIFPNPTADFLTVQFQSNSENEFNISLSDFLGRKFILHNEQEKKGNEFTKTFLLNELPSACYFLTIENSKGDIKKSFPIIKTSH